MDTRRGSDAHEDRPKPELGTETVPVELVELQSVGSSGRRGTPRSFVAIAVVAVLAFSAVVLTRQPQTPVPSPSAPITGVASPTPASSSTSAPTTPATFRPSITTPTPIPTAPPPWQWTPSDFLPDLHASVDGMWGVNDRILALTSTSDGEVDQRAWSIARQGVVNSWELFPAPRAIDAFYAGTVIDGRLWFFAKVGGITEAETTWQLVNTADGENWESMGTSEGLPPFVGASHLARAGDSWALVTHGDDGVGGFHATISWSEDGRHWKPADVPELRANVGFVQAASTGQAAVMLGFEFDSPEESGWIVLRSSNGRTWQRSNFESPSSGAPRELVCSDELCIITVEPPADISTGQALMESVDGERWDEVNVDVPYNGPDTTIRRPATTASGFIALAGNPGQALLSTDGISWRSVEVLPPDAVGYITGLAVAGDSIVAFMSSQSSDEPDRIWVGSLAAMRN